MSDRVDFDQFTDNYNELLRENTGFFSPSEAYFARYKVEILRDRVRAPVSRLLEYGCGIGRNIPFLREAFPGAVIIGSDISGASLEVARRDNPGTDFFLEGEFPESQRPFDVIFVAGVFHHVPPQQRRGVAATLLGRLAPGGTVMVFEHNPFNPVTRRIVSNCPYDKDAVLLKPAELRDLLANAGLQLQRSEYCLFVPPRLSFLSPLESRLGWLPLGGQYWVEARRSA